MLNLKIESRTRVFMLMGASFLITCGMLGASKQPDMASKIDAVVTPAFPVSQPGAALIVVKDGKVLYRKAYGMANLELGVPLAPDMVFRIGSMTKQFTAVAIMMLAEQGKLSVSDPITTYLPDYPTQGHTITIEHLLTHTSGIQGYTEIPGWMTSKILSDMSTKELIDGFKKEPMGFAPGEKWAYSNSGYVLLGAIIEKASGETYEKFVKEHIFDPLGMKSTFYGSNDPIIPRRVEGYTGDPGQIANAHYLSMTQPYAAGSLLSSVDDLAAWDAALYTEKLLKRSSIQKMWSEYKLKDGSPTHYGYGWQIATLQGRPTVEHGGGIFGFSTYGLRLPDDHLYVAVLSNSDNPSADPGYLARKIAAVAIGEPFPERVAISVDPRILERYVGVYQIDKDSQRAVTIEEGKLYTQRTGGQRLQAKPFSDTEFFYENTLTHGRFVLDAQGQVTGMQMYQEGADQPQTAPKVAGAAKTRQAISLDPAVYDRYVGEYELAAGFILTVTREGDRLMTQATGQDKVEVFPESESEFFLKVVDAQITFVKSPDGSVNELILHQGGREMHAKRVK